MPSLRSKILQGIAVSTATSIGAFFVWTKHCKVEYLQPASDPLFANQWYKKLNANANPTLHDEIIRRQPLFKLKPELIEDAHKGGSKLVEALSQGVWGGPGKFSQRRSPSSILESTSAQGPMFIAPFQELLVYERGAPCDARMSSDWSGSSPLPDSIVLMVWGF